MILNYLLAFLAGLIVKATDWIDDEEKGKNQLKWLLAILYGLCIGYLISQAGFSMLFLAALFAQVFAGKIDAHTHVLGFAVAVVAVPAFGMPPFDLAALSIFLLAAFLDELEVWGRYLFIHEYRPFLKVAALGFVLTGRWDFFLSIIIFDFGYVLYELLKQKRYL